jgi:hypothetical protein
MNVRSVRGGGGVNLRVREWGSGDLWVTEFVLTYDGIPSYAVSIMEFREGLVTKKTQYFADGFDPTPSRTHLVERVGEIKSL